MAGQALKSTVSSWRRRQAYEAVRQQGYQENEEARLSLEELRDLPRAVADPVAVFNNYQREGNRSILTELKTQQGNFLVSVNIGKDADINFNIVRSVFGKGNENVVAWINNGLATYINKEKALSFLSHQSAPIAATAANAGQESSSYLHLSAPIAEAAENQSFFCCKDNKDFQ